jgi:hypothetical protein
MPLSRLVVVVRLREARTLGGRLDILPDYAVGWGTLSLINAGLAQTKNRSAFAWWFFSLLLGPIATFLIVVLDAPEAKD